MRKYTTIVALFDILLFHKYNYCLYHTQRWSLLVLFIWVIVYSDTFHMAPRWTLRNSFQFEEPKSLLCNKISRSLPKQFHREFLERKIPHRNTIKTLRQKLRHWQWGDQQHPQWCMIDCQNTDVRTHLEQSPEKSHEVGMSMCSVLKLIYSDLILFPYKVQIHKDQSTVPWHSSTTINKIWGLWPQHSPVSICKHPWV